MTISTIFLVILFNFSNNITSYVYIRYWWFWLVMFHFGLYLHALWFFSAISNSIVDKNYIVLVRSSSKSRSCFRPWLVLYVRSKVLFTCFLYFQRKFNCITLLINFICYVVSYSTFKSTISTFVSTWDSERSETICFSMKMCPASRSITPDIFYKRSFNFLKLFGPNFI